MNCKIGEAKSNYRSIGDFIRLVDERNKGLKVTNLVGLSISKQFIKSVANTIGTDMENYKIINQNQFACSTMQVRRDKKMPLALYSENEPAIISQAYPVFEIIDTNELLPEYLMMWYTRSEFDREACFHAVGGVRGSLEWEDFCGMQLPIPSIEKQREIVREYNTIVNRITLNEQLIHKLEETAQAIYKQWFVEFEFPNENGKPYKTSGGKMVWCEELEKEIPEGWQVKNLKSLDLDISDGNYSSKYPTSTDFIDIGVPFIRGTDFSNKIISPFNLYYISMNQHQNLKKGHTKSGDILMATRGEIGKIAFVTEEFVACNINAQLVRMNGGEKFSTFYLGCLLQSKEYKEELISSTTGSALLQLPRKNLDNTRLLCPSISIVQLFTSKLSSIHDLFIIYNREINKLKEIQELILSKMTKVEGTPENETI